MRWLVTLLGTFLLGGCGVAGEVRLGQPVPAPLPAAAAIVEPACPGGTAKQTRRTADINPLGRTRQTVLSGETCLE